MVLTVDPSLVDGLDLVFRTNAATSSTRHVRQKVSQLTPCAKVFFLGSAGMRKLCLVQDDAFRYLLAKMITVLATLSRAGCVQISNTSRYARV